MGDHIAIIQVEMMAAWPKVEEMEQLWCSSWEYTYDSWSIADRL
jgi:hypothetical protein